MGGVELSGKPDKMLGGGGGEGGKVTCNELAYYPGEVATLLVVSWETGMNFATRGPLDSSANFIFFFY